LNKGYVIYAQNTHSTNYIDCATTLANSLKSCMPNCNVSLITSENVNNTIFDQVIPLPYGDLDPFSDWKLMNDWQVYEASPYEYTIKLEADLYIPSSIDYWWDTLMKRDLVVCTNIRNFKQSISDIKSYRKFIYDNNLPDTYNAITYFKKSALAEKFYSLVRDIFENWEDIKIILKCNNKEPASTDWVYAIASRLVGEENCTLPQFNSFSMIHMKKFINDMFTEDWTNNFVYEILPNTFRINTFPQLYPLHYIKKDFCLTIDKELECRKN
jgi:hypothetical protein